MYCIIFVTCSNSSVANKIVDMLLKKKLIACANVLLNVKSKYWWKGKIESSNEVLVLMKTKFALFDEVRRVIKSLHPYEVPEIICVKIEKGSKEYLKWVEGATE